MKLAAVADLLSMGPSLVLIATACLSRRCLCWRETHFPGFRSFLHFHCRSSWREYAAVGFDGWMGLRQWMDSRFGLLSGH